MQVPYLKLLWVSDAPHESGILENLVEAFSDLSIHLCNSEEKSNSFLHNNEDHIALVILHLTHPKEKSWQTGLIRTIAKSNTQCKILVVVDEYQHAQAVRLFNAGADESCCADDNDHLINLVDLMTSTRRGEQLGVIPQKSPQAPQLVPEQFTFSIEMLELFEQLQRVIPQRTSLLLEGETGTGKTRLARLIHELSPRRNEPFLVLDCSTLSEELIESEMFGHVKGAFTGADQHYEGKFKAAGKGTLLLDEINSLPMKLQSKLLRVVDERMFEPVGSTKSLPMQARIIAASNATSLLEEVKQKRFRADLYYRLNVLGFYLPPLREQRRSIIPLATKLMTYFARQNQRRIDQLSRAALKLIDEYDWPGNIRELSNAIERAVVLARGNVIEPSDLPNDLFSRSFAKPLSKIRNSKPKVHNEGTIAQTKEEAEILRIQQALLNHDNNRLRAAEELGISRMGLYKKLHKYGIMEPK